MKRRSSITHVIIIGFISIVTVVLMGCAGRTPWYGSTEEGFIMQYRFPADQTLNYEAKFNQLVSSERQGQNVDLTSDVTGQFIMKGSHIKESGNTDLEIQISKMAGMVDIAGNTKEVNVTDATEKSFTITLSPYGQMISFQGADSILVKDLDLTGPGRSTVKHFFQYYLGDFFPVLPDQPKKIQDTWTSQAEFSQKLGGIEVTTSMESKYTLAGFETIQGNKCLKVNVESSGIIEGTGAEGMLNLEGDMEYSATFYWDYQKGLLWKYDYELFGEATMAMTDRGTISYVLENKLEISKVK